MRCVAFVACFIFIVSVGTELPFGPFPGRNPLVHSAPVLFVYRSLKKTWKCGLMSLTSCPCILMMSFPRILMSVVKKKPVEEPEEEEDMGFSLFD
jgi:hypothetical protein